MQLDGMASTEIDRSAILVVPLGSTEQHGGHLPLDVDTRIATELCRRLGEERDDVVIAPALVFGASGEHAGFAGTLSIGAVVLHELVVELCRSATDTFARVLLVCGHGGNVEAATGAVRRLSAESRDVRLFTPRVAGDAHAGHVETSMMLAIAPEQVRVDALVAGDSRPLEEIWPTLRAHGLKAVTSTGVLGDPTTATAAHGREILAAIMRDLFHTVNSWTAPAAVGAR